MPRQIWLVLLVAYAAAVPAANAADALWTAKAETMSRQIVGFATVEPRSVLRLRAGVDGIVANLKVQPGDTVTAGEALGQLTGPSIDSLLAARRAAVAGAEATLKSAQQALATEQQKFAGRLTTRATAHMQLWMLPTIWPASARRRPVVSSPSMLSPANASAPAQPF